MAQELNVNITRGGTVLNVTESVRQENKHLKEEVEGLTAQVDQLNSALEASNDKVDRLKSSLDQVSRGTGLTALKEELSGFRQTASVAAEEFATFLRSVNLLGQTQDIDFTRFSGLFESIKSGVLTTGQAITDVKTQYAALFEGGNGADFDTLRQFQTVLNTVAASMDEVLAKVSAIGAGGGVASGGGGQPASVAIDFSEAIRQISAAAATMDAEVRNSYDSIAKLVSALKEYSDVDGDKIFAISRTFQNIGAVGEHGISAKSVTNIVNLATMLRGLGDGAKFKFDITGLDFKVESSSLNALSKFLTSIDGITVPDLSSLSNVDLHGFANVKISSTIGNIGKLLEQVKEVSTSDVTKLGKLAEASAKAYAIRLKARSEAAGIETVALAKAEINEAAARSVEYKGIAEAENIEAQKQALVELTEARRDEARAKQEAAESNRDETVKRNAAAEAARDEAAAAKEEAAAKKEAEQAQKNYNSAREQYQKLSEKTDVLRGGVPLAGVGSQFQELQSLIQTMGDASSSYEERSTAFERFKTVAAQLSLDIANLARTERDEAAAAKEEAAAKKEAAKAQAEADKKTQNDQKTAIATANLQKQSANLMTQIQTKMREYSAAGFGESSEAYKSLDGLAQKLREADAEFADTKDRDAYKLNIADVGKSVAQVTRDIKGSGEAYKTFGSQLMDSLKNMIPFLNAARLAQQIVRVVREMIKSVIEFDDVLTQMQVVTGATENQITAFGNSMFETAKKIGASTADLIDSATVFARLGYSLEESASLAEYTSMLQNVGNIDTSTAQDAITAIFKAFKDTNINDIEAVMDKLVRVGNNFPISVEQLAIGMNNAGSMLAAAGNSFDESVALLTASNATVQNISKASTGLRTITARLRKTKTELDDLGESMTDAQYDQMVQALTGAGVSLTDQNGEFRSTYDILKDIANVWGEMGENERAALAELASGTRQQNVFFSLIENFQEAEGAMEQMANSTGSLQAAYDTYMDSTTAHLNQFRAAWQELGVTLIDSGFLNGFIDIGTTVVDVLSSIIGGVLELTGGLNGLIGVAGFAIGTLSGNWPAAILSAILLVVDTIQQSKQAALEAAAAFADAGNRITGGLSTIGSLSEEFAELSKGVDENGKNVKLTEEEYARYLEIVNQIVDIAPEVVRGYDDQGNAILDYTNLIKDATEALYGQAKAAREAAVAGSETSWKEYSKNYTGGQSSTGSIGRLGVAFKNLIGSEKDSNARLQETAKILKEVGIIVSDDLLDKSSSSYRGSIESLLGGNVDTIYENRDAILAYVASLEYSNGQYVYSKEAIDGLRTALYGLSDAYDSITSAESSATDLLYAWAQSQVGDRGYFDKIPLNQINAFKDGIAGIMDLNLSWAENKAAVDNYGNSWLRLTNMSSEIIKAFEDEGMSAAEFEATMSRLEASTSEVASDAFFDYIRSAYLMEDANDAAAASTERVTTAAERFAESLRVARTNFSALQEKLNGGDLDDDYEFVKDVLEQAQELIKNGEVGSAHLGYIKDFFGIGDLDASQAKAYFDAIQKYFTEGADGVFLFVDEIQKLSEGGLLDGIAAVEKLGEEVYLSFDSDRITEFAAAMGVSTDVLLALLEKFSMYSENFHIDGTEIQKISEEANKPAEKDVTVNVTNEDEIDGWLKTERTMEVSVLLKNGTKGLLSGLLGDLPIGETATGTLNAKPGMSLLGDEWSPGGQPKPELVIGKNGAYLAGTQGPTVGYLNSGDQVYTYDQTKKILSGRGIKRLPGFADGTDDLLDPRFTDGVIKELVRNINKKLNSGGGGKRPKTGSGSGSGGGGSLEKTVEDIKKEFEDLYKYHKHLVAMDQESEEDFLDWLEGAYKEAYEQGAIELDDFRKYEEEVYKGRMDLVKDYLSDLEHQIKMMTNAGADDKSIINVYLQMMEKVEKELQAARDRGLTDDDDYIQELQNNWWSYYNAVNDIREDSNDEAKDAIEDLVQYRIKMIKQELNNEKSALNDKLSYLKEFYDKQKQMLRDTAEEEDYQEQQAEKRRAVSDIEAQIKQLQFDDSAAAQKRRLKLQEDLLKARKDLEDFEKDRALEIAEKQIDTMYENQEKQIESQIEAVDKQLNDPEGLYERALRDVQNNSEALYEAMIEYNARYGSGIRDDIVNMWEEAYISLKRYYDLYGEYYKDINLVNATGYTGPITGNIPKAVGGYATGTRSAQAGFKKFSENGDELIFTSANGTKYRMFQSGEKVLNANATNFLYDFAASGGAILSNFFDKAKGGFDMLRSGAVMGDIVMGDIIINGSATDKTVSEIRRAQRDGVDYLLRKFAQLNA